MKKQQPRNIIQIVMRTIIIIIISVMSNLESFSNVPCNDEFDVAFVLSSIILNDKICAKKAINK